MVKEFCLTVCTLNLDCTGIVTFSTLCHKRGFAKVTDRKHRFPSREISVLVDLCATTVCSVRGRGCGCCGSLCSVRGRGRGCGCCGSTCLWLNGQHHIIDCYVPLPSSSCMP